MTRRRYDVLFFAPSIGGGGAERHLVRLANHLDRARFRVAVAVSRGGGSYEPELAPDVAYHVLGAPRMLLAAAPLRRLLRDTRPDLVCSFLDHANCVALGAARLTRPRPAVVVGVQNTVSVALAAGRGPRRGAIRRAIPRVYGTADAVVALTHGVKADLASLAPRLGDRVRVIHNAGYDAGAVVAAGEPLPPGVVPARPLLVACGRLTEQKDYPTLLRALARVRRELPATLWVVGEGELRAGLEAEAARLGVAGAVWLPGFQDNPYRFMRAADVFVLSSRWEGFGNVIAEAMAVGTPVVSTDCTHGPGEIIEPGRSGLLVPPGDDEALAAALLRVLRDPGLGQALRAGGVERARRFAAPAIAAEYGELFLELLEEPARAEPPRVPPTGAAAC